MGRLCQIWSTLIVIAILTPGADVLAQSDSVEFGSVCEAQISGGTQNARAIVTDLLDKADAALGRGDADQASERLEDAAMATMGVAGWSGATSVKCLGEPTYRRYLDTRQRLDRLRAELDPRNITFVMQRALLDAVQDPAKGKNSVLTVIPLLPRAFHDAMLVCDDIVRVIGYYREIGAFVLPEEQAIADLCVELIPEMAAEMDRHAAETLADEEVAFNRAPTPLELEGAKTLAGIGDLAEAMAGMDIDAASQQKALVIRRQVSESRELLQLAREWEFYPDGLRHDERTPSDLRGEQRGDTMLARGNDQTLSLEVRDEFYTLAQGYFESCNCYDKVQAAVDSRDAIQPALQAKFEIDRQKMEKMQAEMQQKTEAMQQSVDDMQKSEAEQQSFKDEADALEAELDF